MDQQESVGLAPLNRLAPSPAAARPAAPKHSPEHTRYFFGAEATGGIDLATRAFDIVVAIGAIVFFAPLMILVSLAVALTSPGPVLFAHSRIGQHGKLFPCLKFRTMVPNADVVLRDLLATSPAAREEWARDHKLKDDPRVTPIGKWLRKFSLDELPQLFNILAGQMSVVGPRPIVVSEIEKYGNYFFDYCAVRPGLTGLWQVSGRSDVDYDERVLLDVTYARSRTLMFDINIVLRTIPAVLVSRGSY